MNGRRTVATLTALLSTLLVTTLAPSATAAPPRTDAPPVLAQRAPAVGGALTIRPADPIELELTTFKGRLVTRLKRPVELQVATKKGPFTTVSLGGTDSSGRFRFREVVQYRSGVTRVRVLAPRRTVGATTYAAIATRAVRTRIQQQYAVLNVDTPVVAGRATPATATVTPVRAGRAVEIQRLEGSTWVAVATGVQDARGVFATSLTQAAGTSTYRVFSPSRKGAKSVTSDAVTVTASAPPA